MPFIAYPFPQSQGLTRLPKRWHDSARSPISFDDLSSLTVNLAEAVLKTEVTTIRTEFVVRAGSVAAHLVDAAESIIGLLPFVRSSAHVCHHSGLMNLLV